MTVYAYKATDPAGAKTKGTIDASSEHTAHTLLLGQGLVSVTLKEKKPGLNLEFSKKKVKREEVMQFSRQLAAFIRSGIPILEALGVIAEEDASPRFQEVLRSIMDALRAGDTFADAAGQYPDVFPDYYLGTLRAAELTGALDSVLDQLALYIERSVASRNKIRTALIYPSVVMVMAIGTAVLLTVFVLPRFQKFFGDLHAKLPIATRLLLGGSHLLGRTWPILLLAIFGGGAALFLYFRTPAGEWTRDSVLLKVPAVGDVARNAIIERFCRILSSMVRAGVPLPEAMSVAGGGTSSVVYKKAVAGVRERMMQGEGISRPIADTSLFPGAMVQMLRVGENTGTLDDQLDHAATFYSRELEVKLDRLTSLFEPAVILFMGLVVGFVAIALVSAIYGIYNQVNLK